MKEKRRNIGVMTVPVSQAGLVPLRDLAAILCALSTEVHLVTGGAGYSFFAQKGNIHTHRVEQKTTKVLLARPLIYAWTQLRFSWKLVKLRTNVDLWVFFIGGEGLALPAMTAKLLGKKVIVAAAGSQLESARARRDPLTRVAELVRRITYGLSDRLILYSPNLITEWNLDRYRRKISIARKHFLDFDKFKVQKPLTERGNLVGYIGRLSQEKGTANLLEAIPKVIQTKDEVGFVIGGDGQLRPAVEELTDRLRSKVRYAGWISHDELGECLNELKLLVLPSYTEGLPNVMLEAMACGTPVLATPVGAVPDIVKDGETGFIMENNSPEYIAENIVRALTHPDLEQIACNARVLVEKEFTFERAVERYREMLKDLVAREYRDENRR
jgi:glycosyltransferase involved in cell wall biosynthesis